MLRVLIPAAAGTAVLGGLAGATMLAPASTADPGAPPHPIAAYDCPGGELAGEVRRGDRVYVVGRDDSGDWMAFRGLGDPDSVVWLPAEALGLDRQADLPRLGCDDPLTFGVTSSSTVPASTTTGVPPTTSTLPPTTALPSTTLLEPATTPAPTVTVSPAVTVTIAPETTLGPPIDLGSTVPTSTLPAVAPGPGTSAATTSPTVPPTTNTTTASATTTTTSTTTIASTTTSTTTIASTTTSTSTTLPPDTTAPDIWDLQVSETLLCEAGHPPYAETSELGIITGDDVGVVSVTGVYGDGLPGSPLRFVLTNGVWRATFGPFDDLPSGYAADVRITITAADAAGNTTSITATVRVISAGQCLI